MLWSRLIRSVAPATPVVSLNDAKAHLRVDHTADDAYITSLIEVAASTIEGPDGSGITLITQTWQLYLDYTVPTSIPLPLGPVQSVTSITYTDQENEQQTLDPASYELVKSSPSFIERLPGTVWPVAQSKPNAAVITFVAGYGNAAAIPAALRHAILLMVGHLYSNREATTGTNLKETPLGFTALVERYRVGRFG